MIFWYFYWQSHAGKTEDYLTNLCLSDPSVLKGMYYIIIALSVMLIYLNINHALLFSGTIFQFDTLQYN